MNIYKNFRKEVMLTKHEKLVEALRQHNVCKPMNWNLRENDGADTEKRMWLNPENQTCFNSGWFTYQDFYDWMEGKGNIIKGNTDDEKKKFWDVATFVAKYDMSWTFLNYKKYFNLIDENYYPKQKFDFGYYSYIESPLKITKTNHGEIISKIMGDVCRYYGDTCVEITMNSSSYQRMESELQGIKQALFALGVGYYGACNTPQDIENLSWIADICKYKAAYMYFVNNKIPLPDFDFVEQNRCKY